jgi:hypothetical protein
MPQRGNSLGANRKIGSMSVTKVRSPADNFSYIFPEFFQAVLSGGIPGVSEMDFPHADFAVIVIENSTWE